MEVDNEGEIIWQVERMNGPISVQRLENGNTLIAQMNSGKVVEVNREGHVVWQVSDLTQPYDVQRLPNGDTLIAENHGVVQVDLKGETREYLKRFQGASGVSRF